MSWVGDTRLPPLASRAQASRRADICDAVSRWSLSAPRRGETRKLVKLPVNDPSHRFTTAPSLGAVASSTTDLPLRAVRAGHEVGSDVGELGHSTRAVELAVQLYPSVFPEVEPLGKYSAVHALTAISVGSDGENHGRQTPGVDVDVAPDPDVVACVGRLQQLEAHEDPASWRRAR